MDAKPIIEQLHSLGLSVTLEGDRLAVRPPGRLTPELRQAIQDNKPDLIRLLATDAAREGPPYPDGRGLVKCSHCSKFRPIGQEAGCTKPGDSKVSMVTLLECGDFVIRTVH